jgi:hypothetical protein
MQRFEAYGVSLTSLDDAPEKRRIRAWHDRLAIFIGVSLVTCAAGLSTWVRMRIAMQALL